MKWWKKAMRAMEKPEENKKLKKWQGKFENAKSKYQDELDRMEMQKKYYIGDRHVKGNPNKTSGYASKMSINVRNIAYELIESQIDPSIPMPKVTAIHEEDKDKAKIIEDFIKNEMKSLNFNILNDLQERLTPMLGGDFLLVEWNNQKGYHCTIGDLDVSNIHPKQVIPQPGITEIDKMDYIFIRTSQTKDYVKRRFGKDVSEEEETDNDIREGVTSDDIVTVVTAYYKNEKGGIGLFRWCGDVVLEDMEDYQARRIEVCKECGTPKTGDVCEKCGSKRFEVRTDDMETIRFVENEIEMEIQIPYYKPDQFPLVLRKNISVYDKLLGCSDVDVIEDQQDTIKKLGSKINEKLLKGGSFVTLPSDVGVDTTDEELKIIRIDNPAQKALIDVITAQADIGQDRTMLEMNYQWAKSALGITDSYQGKYDSSATSGTAKQYSINQAAGRLESKRVMKNQAYAQLYELMFKFALAYADQPIPINSQGKDGVQVFAHFDKMDFLKMDAAGQYYWNDEFIFDTDPTSTLLTNREAMWNQADLKLQSGAFGPISELETNYLYWLEQERNGYPNAGEIKKEIERRMEERKKQEAMMQMGGMNVEMPNM